MTTNQPITSLSDLLSNDTLDLLTATGNNLIETIGIDVIRGVVLDVLTGRNIRSSTESLTRRRVAALNLAMVDLFIQGTAKMPDFVEQLPHIAADILGIANPKAEEWLANWAIGLTGKGVQNVLRDDRSLLPEYRDSYSGTCETIIEQSKAKYGELSGSLHLGTGVQVEVNWLMMLYLLNMVGSETLTIRGSEKSLYGKFFEKLVLGALLHVLGFEHVPADDLRQLERVFWLSSRSKRDRESDATILYQPGKGIRIDIGFIGRGNTEISLDKVSRYRREIELGNTHWHMGTIIVVDRIGPKSGIQELAEDIDGTIVQMSASYWPKRIALILNGLLGFQHPLITMGDDEIDDYLKEKLVEVPLRDFIRSATLKSKPNKK
jgi:hypothetical protein